MREMDYPVAPMILGIILGSILDKNLRRALVISEGDIHALRFPTHLSGSDCPYRLCHYRAYELVYQGKNALFGKFRRNGGTANG